MAIGALVRAAIGNVSEGARSLAGFAGGSMVFITADELIPDAQEFAEEHSEPSGSSWGFSWECCSFTLPEGKEEFCLCQLGQSIG